MKKKEFISQIKGWIFTSIYPLWKEVLQRIYFNTQNKIPCRKSSLPLWTKKKKKIASLILGTHNNKSFLLLCILNLVLSANCQHKHTHPNHKPHYYHFFPLFQFKTNNNFTFTPCYHLTWLSFSRTYILHMISLQ